MCVGACPWPAFPQGQHAWQAQGAFTVSAVSDLRVCVERSLPPSL